MVQELLRNRELILTLVKRDLKVRYKASALGFLWSFGRPLFLMLIMWGVFSQIVKIQTEIPYALHLLTAILPWMFLQASLMESTFSIQANSNVVQKVALPTAAFPISTVLSQLVHLLLALPILFLFILGYTFFSSPSFFPGWEIIFLPFIILIQFFIICGLSLILSSLYVYYRDVGSIAEIVISAWFYLTPIIYPVQEARKHLKGMMGSNLIYYLYLLNPMTPITVAYRRVLYGRHLNSSPEISDQSLLIGLGGSIVFALVICWIGVKMFSKLSRRFADEL